MKRHGRTVLRATVQNSPHSAARHGTAPHDAARHRSAPHGAARHFTAQHGAARHGTARCGTARQAKLMAKLRYSSCVLPHGLQVRGGADMP